MNTHTPGPWERDGDDIVVVSAGVEVQICSLEHSAVTERRDANAWLIAAAPDLLELAKCMQIWVQHHRHGGEVDWLGVEQQIRNAIARAGGYRGTAIAKEIADAIEEGTIVAEGA